MRTPLWLIFTLEKLRPANYVATGGVYFLLAGTVIAIWLQIGLTVSALIISVLALFYLYFNPAKFKRQIFWLAIGFVISSFLTYPTINLSDNQLIYQQNFSATILGEYSSMSLAELSTGERVFIRNIEANYGDKLDIKGAFFPNDAPIKVNKVDSNGMISDTYFLQSNSFVEFCLSKQVVGIVTAKSVDSIEIGHGFRSKLSQIQQKISDRFFQVLPNKSAQICAAMLIGDRSKLDKTLKNNMALAGIIHLFSVSGLHVGVVALLFSLIFVLFPRRQNRLLLIIATGVYVLMCGAQIPACRAWFMLSMVMSGTFLKLRFRPLSILALVAVILLWLNPQSIRDVGFQFSFAITTALLLFAERWGKIVRKWNCNDLLIPRKTTQYNKHGWSRECLGGICGCIIAYFTTLPILLYSRGVVVPISLVINILLLPIILPLFGFGFLTLLLPWLAPITVGLTNILDFLANIGSEFYTSSSAIATPFWLCLLYLIALFWLIKGQSRLKYFSMAIIVIWLFVVFAGHLFIQPYYLIASGDSSAELTVVAVDPPRQLAYLLNRPNYEMARGITAQLAKSGVREIEVAVHDTQNKRNNKILENLITNNLLQRILTPESDENELISKKDAICVSGKAIFTLKNHLQRLNYGDDEIIVETKAIGLSQIRVRDITLALPSRQYVELYIIEMRR